MDPDREAESPDRTGESPAAEGPTLGYTTAQVAKRLGVSPSLVRTWVAAMNWELRRNAQGHRTFTEADVLQLEDMKAWLDKGHTLKGYQREVLGVGPYDPRKEIYASQRKLSELLGRWEALQEAERAVADRFSEERDKLAHLLEAVRQSAGDLATGAPEGAAKPEAPAPEGSPLAGDSLSLVVQGVLKQLLTSLLARQGRLQLVGRHEDEGRVRLEYLAPNGKRQLVDEVCTAPADRDQLETILRLIAPPPAPKP